MPQCCRLCGADLFPEALLVQPQMPAAAQGLPTATQLSEDHGVNLSLHQCSGCGVVQLNTPPVAYWRDVIRAAGISEEMRAYRLQQFGSWLKRHQLQGKKVLEVGSGRGEYLALLAQSGLNAHGIEHARESVTTARQAGLQIEQGFINGPSDRLMSGPFDAFAILNFLEHIPTAHLTLRGIANNLKPGGMGLVEVPDFDMILRNRLFAEFIPDHLYYFTRTSLTHLLENNGFEVLECRSEWHGYVLSAQVRKRAVLDLSPLIKAQAELKESFKRFLAQFPTGRVAIWGAGHQALALISLLDLAPSIRYVVDSAPFKQGRYTPATHLPIVAPERLAPSEVDAVIVLAASYSTEVARLLRERHDNRYHVALLDETSMTLRTETPSQ